MIGGGGGTGCERGLVKRIILSPYDDIESPRPTVVRGLSLLVKPGNTICL